MQHHAASRSRARALSLLLAALALCACSPSPPLVQYSEAVAAAEAGFALFTTDPLLHEAALRARRRMTDAIGETGLTLASPELAPSCQPFQGSCGFELAFADVVYCRGDPHPALACTAQGARGAALGIKVQASLAGVELDNRLIHELFHVITFNRAPHARDGLFMEYSFGDERISEGTLEAVCAHFSCSHWAPEM